MACATLKRSLDFDPVHSPGRPPKRQRCSQMYMSPSSPTRHEGVNPSPFEAACSRMTPEKMAARIHEEFRRMNRRKQLNYPSGDGHDSASDVPMDSPGSPTSSSMTCAFSNKEKPLFTFQQVGLICERMLKEQEGRIREEYDRILHTKLSEQYDTFVKFTYDQLQKRFESDAMPSYLS
ncbi:akirin [Bacillus rossius redtenbacheri]|uniref:akirin n=1 Tax=Bacillus rossius redtenbacheri TaxID=93214 RepID=UPI002FDE0EE7